MILSSAIVKTGPAQTPFWLAAVSPTKATGRRIARRRAWPPYRQDRKASEQAPFSLYQNDLFHAWKNYLFFEAL